MLKIYYTKRAKRDLKVLQKRGLNISKLDTVLNILVKNETLPLKYKDHALSGNYAGFRECHIEPDWLLIYKIENNILILTVFRTGTHSDLF